MASRYGHAWVSQYGAAPSGFAGAEWRETLAGLNNAQLREGFRADVLRGAEWPPSSTAFRAMCFDLPTFATVRTEIAAENTRRSPFSMLTYELLDRHRFRMADSDKADRLLREAYDTARAHVMHGGGLPEVLPEIAKPEQSPRRAASDEVVKAACADIEAILGPDAPDAPEAIA